MKTFGCAECRTRFPQKQRKQMFCSSKCKDTYHNRMAKRGKVLAPLVLAYRVKRGGDTARWAHTEFCRLASQFNEEDKTAGRMSANLLVSNQLRMFTRA